MLLSAQGCAKRRIKSRGPKPSAAAPLTAVPLAWRLSALPLGGSIPAKGDHLITEDAGRKLFFIDLIEDGPELVIRLVTKGEWHASTTGSLGVSAARRAIPCGCYGAGKGASDPLVRIWWQLSSSACGQTILEFWDQPRESQGAPARISFNDIAVMGSALQVSPAHRRA